MAQRVLDGQLDLAIAALDVAIPDGVSTRVLLDEPVLVALPRSHTLAGEPAVEVGRLRDDPYVLFRSGTGLRTITAPQVRTLPLSRRTRTVGLLSRPDRSLSPGTRALRELLVDASRHARLGRASAAG
jgi:DNA-binding transcriptional LysR family regulator